MFGEDDKHTCSVRRCSTCAPPLLPLREQVLRERERPSLFRPVAVLARLVTRTSHKNEHKRDRPTILTFACPSLPRIEHLHQTVVNRTHPKRKSSTMRCVLSEFSFQVEERAVSSFLHVPVTRTPGLSVRCVRQLERPKHLCFFPRSVLDFAVHFLPFLSFHLCLSPEVLLAHQFCHRCHEPAAICGSVSRSTFKKRWPRKRKTLTANRRTHTLLNRFTLPHFGVIRSPHQARHNRDTRPTQVDISIKRKISQSSHVGQKESAEVKPQDS